MSEPIKFEISTDCSCQDENEQGEFVEAENCFGCWDDLLEQYDWAIYRPWMEANNLDEDDVVELRYGKLDWDRKSGNTFIPVKDFAEFKPLRLRGDFTLRFTLNGQRLTVVRSSHDEYGAEFELLPIRKMEESNA